MAEYSNIELMDQKITEYLSDISTLKNVVKELEYEKSKLEKELSGQKSQVKELKQDNADLSRKLDSVKEEL